MSVTETAVFQGFRLSPQQRRIWQLQEGLEPFVAECSIRIEGPLDAAALRQALARIVERHEILRTTFQSLPGMKLPLQSVQEIVEEGDGPPVLEVLLAPLDGEEHRLELRLPAACADAWSLLRLFQEIADTYGAAPGSGPAEGILQYVDFAEWQNQFLETEDLTDGQAYWRGQIPSDLGEMTLPWGRPEDAPETGATAAVVSLDLPPSTVLAAERAIAELGTTRKAFFLTCWQILLARLTGRSEIVIGAGLDGRFSEEMEGALGLFAKYPPLRLATGGDRRFPDLLRETERALEGAGAWQDSFVPDGPFFPFGFDCLELPPAVTAGGARFTLLRAASLTERFKVRLSTLSREDGIALELRVDPGYLCGEPAERLLAQFVAVVEGVAAEPRLPVGEIEIVAGDERRALLSERNATGRSYPESCLHDLFAEQAALRPDAVALASPAGPLTYGDLDRRAAALSRRLQEAGVGRGSVVGLHFERGAEMVAALLAVLRSGAAYVALPPQSPPARLEHILEEAVTGPVLTTPDLAARWAVRDGIDLFVLDWESLAEEDGPAAAAEVVPDDLAYVVYTSGSTGRPKGVLTPHRGAVSYLDFLRHTWDLGPEDVVLQVADLGFDASIRDILGPLASGARVVLLDPVRARDPQSMLEAIDREGVTCILSIVPTVLRSLLDAAERGAPPCGRLRLILASGEVLRGADADRVRRAFGPQATLVNQYGPTETTMTASFHRVAPGAAGEAPLPVGRPIGNVRVYLLDERQRLAPDGVAGEVYLGGVGVTCGYLERADQTAERFVPDPYSGVPGSRLYRTGDLAVWNPARELEFRGRIDQQLKVRGVRVEPGEIEAVLAEHPAVARAAVAVREKASGEPGLAAYVVLRGAAQDAIPAEQRYVLPDGMAVAHLNRYETDFFYQQIFQDHVELRHGVTLADDDVIFDVGANVGLFTLFAHRVCRNPRVYSFEPIPEIFATLRANVEHYKLGARLFNCGVSDHSGEIAFTYYPNSACQSGCFPDIAQERHMLKSIIGRQRDAAGGGMLSDEELDQLIDERMQSARIVCPLKTVSEVLAEEGLERIDLLKIDVEKSELHVLQGIRDEDWPKIRQIVIEGHDLGGTVSMVGDMLEKRGYTVGIEREWLLEDTCLYNIYAVRGERRDTAPARRLASGELLPLVSGAVEDFSVEALRSFAGERLPEAMVPFAFVVLDAMPQTTSGKIDRAALPAPVTAGGPEERGSVAPRTPVEEVLAAIWCEVLGREQVGVRDDFFALGGHSLIATQVVLRIREAFGIELPLRSLFEQPTIERLAAMVETARGSLSASAPPLAAVGRDLPLPLSFAQERLWFLDQLRPGNPFYNLPGAVRLTGPLRVPELRRALADVVRRHEALRTRFAEVAGRPVQVIDPPVAVPLPVVDLSGLPVESQELECEAQVLAEAMRPFDLAHGPLLRVALLRLAPESHVMVFDLHHVISDGWSNGLFFRELAALYREHTAGVPAGLAELPVQYADYAVWQRGWLQGEVLAAEVEHWRGALADVPWLLDLPTDHPRPSVPTQKGARVGFQFPNELSQRIAALGRGASATLFMTLLAGFEALLYRHSGQERFTVGTPVAGRDRLETERLIGFFNNNVVLPADLSAEPSFQHLLERAREICLTAFDHQALPFEKLVEALNPDRSLSHSPLFQVSFVLQSQNTQSVWGELPRLPELDVAAVELERGTAKFDLVLSVQELSGGLAGNLEYSTDLFDAATAERLVEHLRRLLAAAAEAPATRIGDLPLLAAAERDQLVHEWGGAARESAETGCLHELFAAQAAARPQAVAAVQDGLELTYGELDRRARQLAAFLRKLGVGSEVPVGICFERSLDLLVAVLGTLKAGGAYVPLDPSHPQERLSYVLADAGAPVLLTQSSLLPRLAPSDARVVCLEESWAEIERESGEDALPAVQPGNLAYVIYTSGSTGRPKGTLVTHANVTRLLRATEDWFDFGPDDVWTLFHSPAFDFSVWEIWGALAYGGRLVLVPHEVSRSPEAFHGLLEAERVTVLNQTPSAFQQLDRVDAARGSREALSALRWVIFGGEALDLEGLRDWFARHGEERPRLVNMYGITETTVHVTGRPVGVADLSASWRSPIGGPISDLSLHLLDARGRLVPVGVAGEVHVGGAGVSRGYLGRPDLTAERFVPDPFSGTPGARLYRSGDLARRLPSGDVAYLGRIDHQVKIRGFRIELGEIEAALASHPGVREAVVMAREDLATGPGLVAYVAPSSEWAGGGGAGLVPALRASLRERLPDYMVPSGFVVLSSLPLTANGKVDRRALPAPESHREGVEAARDQFQSLIAAIWCEVLGLQEVGIEEDFFDLGGHSLLATQVVSRIRESFGVDLQVSSLFLAPTVAALSLEVEAALRGGAVLSAPPIAPADRGGALPLSFAQARLWLLDLLAPGDPSYNVPVEVRINGDLDTDALASALSEVIRRHEVLRTRFEQAASQPVQIIEPAEPVTLPAVDLSDLPEEEREARMRELARDMARRGFDLAGGPPIRFQLVRLAPQEHALLLVLHHIATDGWSMGVLVRELTALYQACHEGRPSPLAELPVQYADYAVWQRNWLQGEVLEAQLAYWQRQLDGSPALLELAADRPRPPVQSREGASVDLAVAPAVGEAVRGLSRRAGATMFMTVLAAYAALLHRYSGGADSVNVGTAVANRGRIETEDLIGFFANTLVLRLRCGRETGFGELLAQARRVVLEGQSYQDVPFELVVDRLRPERNLSHSPLFQHFFTYEDASPDSGVADLSFLASGIDTGAAKFDLSLAVASTHEGGLRTSARYSTALFDATTVERMVRHFERLLSAVVTAPEQPLGALDWLSPEERRQLLAEGNDTSPLAEGCATVVEAFEAQVDRAPEAVALLDSTGEISYGELDRRANRLAHHLRRRGIGPEQVVGLCTARDAWAVVGMLGVLKAGAAYLPIDPTLPAARKGALIEDSRAAALVTRQGMAEDLPRPAIVVDLDGDRDALSAEPGERPQVRPAPEHLAYVIYTSGSTGSPKGVMIQHRGLPNLCAAQARSFGLGPDDRVLQFASLSFDASVSEIWVTLAAGATLVLASPEETLPGLDLFELLRGRAITEVTLPPSALAALPASAPDELPALRTLVVAGEACPSELARRWAEGGRRVVNAYGPTELTVCGTMTEVTGAEARLPIGLPISGARAYVVDERLEPVPAGLPGELGIGGVGVARGYLGQPAQTAARFVPDPFSGRSGDRLYRTGDLVRRRTDGLLEFLGRIDAQIKLRGYRIEPGEVESALLAHPGVSQALVRVAAGSRGDRFLTAYVVPAEGWEAQADELRSLLRRSLPEYMVPSLFLWLKELPRTATGKVDVRALPPIEELAGLPRSSDELPAGELEERIAAIWGEVLPVPSFGVSSNFFDLGGHSLLLVQVQARLQEELGRPVSLTTLFRFPSVRSLASFLAGEGEPAEELARDEERGRARRSSAARLGERRRRAISPMASTGEGESA